jgi:ribonucleoside-diphosphate reductase alpha chain
VQCADPAGLLKALEEELPVEQLPGLEAGQRELLRRAWEVEPEAQIQLQARVQSHVDGAVSKTVHLPAQIRPEGIGALIELAWRTGCKGVSFFRRGCAPELSCGSET